MGQSIVRYWLAYTFGQLLQQQVQEIRVCYLVATGDIAQIYLLECAAQIVALDG